MVIDKKMETRVLACLVMAMTGCTGYLNFPNQNGSDGGSFLIVLDQDPGELRVGRCNSVTVVPTGDNLRNEHSIALFKGTETASQDLSFFSDSDCLVPANQITRGNTSAPYKFYFVAGSFGDQSLTVRSTFDASLLTSLSLKLAAMPLTVNAPNITMVLNSGNTYSFVASGGVPPYSYALAGGSGSIDSSGTYTAGTSGSSATVLIMDSQSQSVTATVSLIDRFLANGRF